MAETITEEMEAFRETLKKEGLAATRQRLQLAEIIFSTHQHFTADDLYDWTRKKGWMGLILDRKGPGKKDQEDSHGASD